jgi:rSAM/selenodomain-associated transferase 1
MNVHTISYVILNPASRVAARSSQCALAVMAKAPRVGKVKTRLSPPLTLDQSAAINICFLRDTAATIGAASASGRAAGLVSYTPVGEEALFDGLLPADFALIPQRGDGFGERLLATAEDILSCGYGSVCLIDSDSPTVPIEFFERAVAELERDGDRIVLGPAHDGGYYLIGLKCAHASVFQGIGWSTSAVFAETVAAAEAVSIEVVTLPLWYDVDDAESLEMLRNELLRQVPPPFATECGDAAEYSKAFLHELDQKDGDT